MSEKLKNIEHTGTVEDISSDIVSVKIQPRTACGSCKSKLYCGLKDVDDKVIEITTNKAKEYKIGQEVTITLKESLGYKALMIGYLIPLIILMVALIPMMLITNNEPLSALVAVSLMVPYYTIVYVKRNKLRKTFNFYIKEY